METKETEFTEHLYTPQLAGVSKTTKKMYQKSFQHRLEQQSTSANTSLDMIPQLESKRTSDVNVHLQKQRELAEITLRRASEKFPYGSMFKTPIKEDSSVNESDLMKMSGISNFGQNVQVASTPRSSVRDSLGISAREVAEETRRQSATFDELIHKLKTSGKKILKHLMIKIKAFVFRYNNFGGVQRISRENGLQEFYREFRRFRQ